MTSPIPQFFWEPRHARPLPLYSCDTALSAACVLWGGCEIGERDSTVAIKTLGKKKEKAVWASTPLPLWCFVQ